MVDVKNKIVEKVEALIARTASDSEAEARTCAVLACKLIREHELSVVVHKDTVQSPPPASAWPGSSIWEEGVEEIFRHVGDAVRVQPGPPSRSYSRDDMRIFNARYDGRCAHCQEGFRAGSRVVTFPKKGKGVYHEACSGAVKP